MVSWSFFKESRPVFKESRPFCKKGGIPPLLAFRGPKSAFWGPEWDLPGPCEKPFINISKWEVFWRLKTGKVHFWPKKTGIPPQNRNLTKNFQNCCFRAKAATLTKHCLFCCNLMYLINNGGAPRAQNHKIWWNLVGGIWFNLVANLVEFGGI